MQTGYTLNQGEFDIGIGPLGIGITDQFQIETNILLFLFQVYNAKVKVNAFTEDDISFSAGLDFRRLDLEKFTNGEEIGFNTFSPYLAFSKKVNNKTTLHFSGKYTYSNVEVGDFVANSSASGSEIMAGLDYSLSNKTKLLAETGYDMTFKGLRIGGGVLFGWESFRLKLGVSYFNPENTVGFTLPVIGFWWRFNG